MRLADYESSICPCGCGQSVDIAYDKGRAFKVDFQVCQAGRAMDQVRRMHKEEAERQKKPDGWDDGRRYYVMPVDNDERAGGDRGD